MSPKQEKPTSPVDKEIKKKPKNDEPPEDPREDWEKENIELEDRKPTLSELEDDTEEL